MADSEIGGMKIKDLFDVEPILTGRTQIDTVNKLNTGLIWSTPGIAFHAGTESIDWSKSGGGETTINSGSSSLFAEVNIPNGATITKAIVYGNDISLTWSLRRTTLSSGGSQTMASANIGTEDTSISFELIDNATYAYFVIAETLGTADSVDGASITYTI